MEDGVREKEAQERRARLEALAAQLRSGEYRPDLEALARKLLEKEPWLAELIAGRDKEKS